MFKSIHKYIVPLIVTAAMVILSKATFSSNSIPSPEWIGIFDVKGDAGLIWIKSPEVSFYKVYRRRTDENSFSFIGETRDNRYIDGNIQPRITYYYRLVGVSSSGEESSPSGEIAYTFEPKVKEVVKAPQWEGYLIEEKNIGLKWKSFSPELVVAYNIYRTVLPEGKEELLASTRWNTFNDYNVQLGRQYRYRVTALDNNFKETRPSADMVVYFEIEEEEEEKISYQWTPKKTYLVRSFTGGDERGTSFLSPTDVVLSPNGLLFVADSGNGLIQVFTRDGEYRYEFSVPPAVDGSPSYPLGLTIGRDGRIYCTDAHSGRILIFQPRGNLVKIIELPKEEKLEGNGLLDICTNKEGDIFAVDNFNHRIAVFDANYNFMRFFGEPGLAPGQLTYPGFCVVDQTGRLLVTESLGGRLQMYDETGDFVKAFGRYGKTVGCFARPKGVALDSKGRIYVADSWLCQIQAFDEDGRFLFTLADEKDKQLDLGSPNGIFVDDQDNIYIAERLAHRVQIRHIQND